MTTTIPCRAQNPDTCKYHGAERRADHALKTGNIDGYLTAQADMLAAIKTTPEVVDFFSNHTQTTATVTQRFNTHLQSLNPDARLQAAIDKTIPANPVDAADRTRHARITNHFKRRNHEPYLVGGDLNQVQDATGTPARATYQETANLLLKNVSPELTSQHNGVNTVNWYTFETDYNTFTDNLLDTADSAQPTTHTGETIRTLSQVLATLQPMVNTQPNGVETLNLNFALKALDKAYWATPNGPAPITTA